MAVRRNGAAPASATVLISAFGKLWSIMESPTSVQHFITNKETCCIVVLLEIVHDSLVTVHFVLSPRRCAVLVDVVRSKFD